MIDFINEGAENIPKDEGNSIPGRGDLRISLTSACNLKCSYCHNEGQKAPWLQKDKIPVMLNNIEKLLEVGATHKAKSIKFTGGDPGVYPGIIELLGEIKNWRERFPTITKWGLCTNGVPFLNHKKFKALCTSHIDNISIGIDSVEPDELSKPSSTVGISGGKLIEKFVAPLLKEWEGRSAKFDIVFAGDKQKTANAIQAARTLSINASIIEINGVMDAAYTVRKGFIELIEETAEKYNLKAQLYKPLNEIYLYDEQGNTPIKFYQDHCRDLDCGNCRKIHLRVSPTAEGWGAIPCFLKAQSKIIPLTENDKLSNTKFEDAIKYNGRGPLWFIDSEYMT